MTTPSGTPTTRQLECLKVIASDHNGIDQEDDALAPFCGDLGLKTDTFNSCIEAGWVKTWHNEFSDNGGAKLTNSGHQAIENATLRADRDRLREKAKSYICAVQNLFAARQDGPCLAEREPSKDQECLDAFTALNRAGVELRGALQSSTGGA